MLKHQVSPKIMAAFKIRTKKSHGKTVRRYSKFFIRIEIQPSRQWMFIEATKIAFNHVKDVVKFAFELEACVKPCQLQAECQTGYQPGNIGKAINEFIPSEVTER